MPGRRRLAPELQGSDNDSETAIHDEENNEEEQDDEDQNEDGNEQQQQQQSNDLTTLPYVPSMTTRYTHYQIPSNVATNLTETQTLLKSAAKLLENIRVAYSEEEKINDDNGNTGFDPDSIKEKAYAGYVEEIDGHFKESMDVIIKSHLLTSSVKETVKYASQNLLPNDITINAENFEEYSQVEPLDRVLQNAYKEKLANVASLPQSKKFSDREIAESYSQFRQLIFDVNHGADEEMPSVETYFDDYNEADSDLVEARAIISYKCPLTKQYFEDPVTSQVCNHSFSSAAIMEVIVRQRGQSRGATIKCPVTACGSYFSKGDLKPNPDLAKRALARKEREIKASQRHNEDIEVI